MMAVYELRDGTYWQTENLLNRIVSLATGDYARLIFDNTADRTWEYMWVRVKRGSAGQWQGLLCNSPSCFKQSELGFGASIAFNDKHILELMSKAQGDVHMADAGVAV